MGADVDDWLVLGTRLDTKELEKGLKEAQKDLEDAEKENKKLLDQKQKIEVEIEIKKKDLDRQINEINKELENRLNRIEMDPNRTDVETRIQGAHNLAQYETEKATKSWNTEMETSFSKLSNINAMLEENNIEQEKAQERIDGINNKIEETNQELEKAKRSSDISQQIQKVGNSVEKVSKKLIKWSLYLVGIRTAFSAVSQAMNIIKEDNEQIGNDIEFIKYTFAYSIEPIIIEVINFVKELLLTIGQIIKMTTGKDIFQDTRDRLKESADKAKEIKKLTAGWDEMTILSDNSSTSKRDSAIKGGDDFNLDNFDMYETKMAKGIQNLTKQWLDFDELLNEVCNNPEFFDESMKSWSQFSFGLTEIISGLSNILLGILEIIGGLGMMIVGIFTGDFQMIEEGWKIVWEGIVNILQGALKIVMGAIDVVWGFLKQIFDAIIDCFDSMIDGMVKDGNGFLAGILTTVKQIITAIFTLIDGLINSIRNIFGGLVKIFKGQFKEGFIQIGKGIANALITILNTLIDLINSVWLGLVSIVDAATSLFGKDWNLRSRLEIPHVEYLAKGGIINLPGKGVPLGQARGGEAGQEGVLPLTDEQQMERLGASIGRHVVINATIVNSMNGRVLNRELKRINGSDEFAFNK